MRRAERPPAGGAAARAGRRRWRSAPPPAPPPAPAAAGSRAAGSRPATCRPPAGRPSAGCARPRPRPRARGAGGAGRAGRRGRARPAPASSRSGSGSGRCGAHSPAASAGSCARLSSADHLDAAGQRRLGAVLGRDDDRLGAAARAPPRRSPARPGTGRTEPSSASSPTIASRGSRPSSSWPEAVSSAAAIARSMPGPGLAQAGRREVGDDPAQRELEAAVDQRRPHPLARLPHRGVGEADDGEGRQAAVDVDLDPDRAGRRCRRG